MMGRRDSDLNMLVTPREPSLEAPTHRKNFSTYIAPNRFTNSFDHSPVKKVVTTRNVGHNLEQLLKPSLSKVDKQERFVTSNAV